MVPCSSNGKTCYNHSHVCIGHPLCDYRSLCYPLNKATYEICSSFNKILTRTSRPHSSTNIKPFHSPCDWRRDGVIVLKQLKNPTDLFIDDEDGISIYRADSGNHRTLLSILNVNL